jgi:ABC-type Na+ transport system ATPase subunit NatA
LEEADLLCNRVAILVKGRILAIDTPQVLKAKTDKKSLEEAFMKIAGLEPEVLAIEKGK